MNRPNPPTRRAFLTAGILGATAIVAEAQNSATQPVPPVPPVRPKIRYSDLLPYEFRARLAQRPIAYLPLGTLEWHGEHLPLGADAIQSEALMLECASRFGGIVMPPIHLGPDSSELTADGKMLIGMDRADTTKPRQQLDGSCYWVSGGVYAILIDAILTQLKRAGFKAVFADGHGPSRWSWVDGIPDRERRFGLKLFGVTKEVADQWKSQIDHAARNETALVMHYRPELADLSRLPQNRAEWPQGVGGEDPRDATAAHGKECMEKSIELVRQLLSKAGLLG